jgi:hypothetical protein
MEYMLKRWTAFTRFLDDGRAGIGQVRDNTVCLIGMD